LVAGTRGSVTLPRLDTRHHGGYGWWTPIESERTIVPEEDPLTLRLRHFIEVVRGETEPLIDGREGTRTLETTVAVKRAAATGEVVPVLTRARRRTPGPTNRECNEDGMNVRGHMLSISHLTALHATPPELVSAAAGAGFDAVGIRMWPAADEPAYPMLGDTPMMRETLARLADTGLRVLDVEVLRLRPDTGHDDAQRILDAGERLGARGVLVICNDPEETRLVERFRAVCEAAAERGMRACLEFMIFSSVRTLADAVRVIDRTAHPAAAILVDALHVQRSGATPADIAALPPAWLPYAQLCDGSFEPIRPPAEIALSEARTGRLLPGDGELPLRQLIDALPADAIGQNVGTTITALLPALFATVAPPGSDNIPLKVGGITFAVTVVAAIAAFTARETYRIHLNDLGHKEAVPIDKLEYVRLRAQTLARAG
jgi:sugar phosphate isomerase/epimerase